MSKLLKILLILYILIYVSCSQRNRQKLDQSVPKVSDTIPKVFDTVSINMKSLSSEDTCSGIGANYYKRFGILISKYFLVKDSLGLDLNGDTFIDTLVILSPITLELAEFADCNVDKNPKRLVIEILNIKGKSKIRNTYSNLVSSIGGTLSKYNNIQKTNKGFKIHHQSGAKYSWDYYMEFSTANRDSITLRNITKTCSFDEREKRLEYSYNNYSIKNIKIMDTLNVNCNCDNIWYELEK